MAGSGATVFEAIAAKEITANSINLPNPTTSVAGIKVGDLSNVDKAVLLHFAIDREWYFMQESTGATTSLCLVEGSPTSATGSNKAFRIQSGNDGNAGVIEFKPGESNDGGSSIKITNNKTDDQGFAIEIDRDANDAADAYAMKIVSDNAGAGKGAGIDMSAFSADEPIFSFPADAVSSAGTLTHQAAVNVGGTLYYIPLYTTGS